MVAVVIRDVAPSHTTAALTAVAGVVLSMLLAGCSGGLAPSAPAAAGVAEQFSEAVAEGRGVDACDLLVPAAQRQVAEVTGSECADGITTLGLPEAGTAVSEQAHGRASFVELEHDTVFLAVSGSSWKVRAAGCVEQGEAPYDCVLEGD